MPRTLQVIECIRISIATEDIPIRSHESPYTCRPIVQNESRDTIALQPLARLVVKVQRGEYPGGDLWVLYLRMLLGFLFAAAIVYARQVARSLEQ